MVERNVNGKLVLNTDSEEYNNWIKSQEQKQKYNTFLKKIKQTFDLDQGNLRKCEIFSLFLLTF